MSSEKHQLANAMLEIGIELLIDIAKQCDNFVSVTRKGNGEQWKITVEKIKDEGEHENE